VANSSNKDGCYIKTKEVPALDPTSLQARDERILLIQDHLPPDDTKEFPANAALNWFHFGAEAGLSAYRIVRASRVEDAKGKEISDSLFARDLDIDRVDDILSECYRVLDAHGWLDRRFGLAAHIVEVVESRFGLKKVRKLREKHGENAEVAIAELAALVLTKPLSRLWYVVNMQALFYLDYDDFRLGFLWGEYRAKMRFEADSQRGQKTKASARVGGRTRAARGKGQIDSILSAMAQFIDSGKSISNAARLAFNTGLGRSPEANRKLWQRHQCK
jgi:hypothetical protein